MWVITLTIFLIGFSLTLCLAVYSRYSNGASTSDLIQSKFYEITPVRALFWLMIGLAAECGLLFLYLLILQARQLYGQEMLFTPSAFSLLPRALLTAASAACGWLLWSHVIVLADRIAPEVDVRKLQPRAQIDAHYLSSLGAERFPNHIDPEGEANNILRWIVISGSILAVGLLSYAGYAGWLTAVTEAQSWDSSQQIAEAPSIFMGVALFFLWSCCVLLALLLSNNHDYTFLPFRQSLLCQGVLCGLIVVDLYIIGANSVYTAIAAGGCLFCCAARAARDLWLSYQYKRTKQVTDPIAADLRRLMPYLDRISEHPDFKLPELDAAALGERITRGCVNVEERGLFVLRSFARQMGDLEIEHQNFTVAMLRYLTVDRGVTLSGGVGTYEGTRHPCVPVWNLELFPLNSPVPREDDGFRDMDDPLTLGYEWDVVRTCSRCNGLGWIWQSETYSEPESYTDASGRSQSRQVSKTRWVQVTCPTCSGSGKTRHSQILNTWWRYLVPRITDPEIPMPELVENAEEQRYFYFPLTVEGESVPFSPETYSIDDPLVNQMVETVRELAALHPKHSQSVLSLKGGRLYKADFQICGFRTIHILFNELGGKGGWFFGKRPEFYFPRLPLSYATVGTILFLPPLALAIAVLVQQMIAEAFSK